MTSPVFQPFNAVALVLRLVLALGDVTQQKARDRTGIGEKPFRALLGPKADPRQPYVARLAPLLGMDEYAWIGLIAEVTLAITLRREAPAKLEELPQLFHRVVELARRVYGAAKVDRQLARRAAKLGPTPPPPEAQGAWAEQGPGPWTKPASAQVLADFEAVRTGVQSASAALDRLGGHLGQSPESKNND